jgi:hypothetical protein
VQRGGLTVFDKLNGRPDPVIVGYVPSFALDPHRIQFVSQTSNRDPLFCVRSGVLDQPRHPFCTLRPGEGSGVIEYRSRLELVLVGGGNFIHLCQFEGLVSGDAFGRHGTLIGSDPCFGAGGLQAFSQVVRFGFGSNVQPPDDKRKEEEPDGDCAVSNVSGGHPGEGTDDSQERGDYDPYKVHNERDRPPPNLLHIPEKDIPVLIVLGENNEGRQYGRMRGDLDGDVMES